MRDVQHVYIYGRFCSAASHIAKNKHIMSRYAHHSHNKKATWPKIVSDRFLGQKNSNACFQRARKQ